MYDAGTESLIDQFLGVAVSGPLRELNVELTRLPVTTTSWGQWKTAHPDTTVIARGAGTGLTYTGNFLGERDADGPIFPIGAPDERLPVHEPVFGVETPEGLAVAFRVSVAVDELDAGQPVAAGGVEVELDAGGLAARVAEGGPLLPGHQAFWFAWSQFRPDTLLWTGP